MRSTFYKIDEQNLEQDRNRTGKYNFVAIGVVIDTNDPQQQGRLRAVVPAFGDPSDGEYVKIPWADYAPPFGGASTVMTRGPYTLNDRDVDLSTKGNVAYGMWAIPKVGAQVYVMCINGNPSYRVWVGCKLTKGMPHTMPHGRYSVQNDIRIPKEDETEQGEMPAGPFSSREEPIYPLYDYQTKVFSGLTDIVKPRHSYEWRTRGADVGVAGISTETSDGLLSEIMDDQDDKIKVIDSELDERLEDDFYYRHGFFLSRQDHLFVKEHTNLNLDSQTVAITTPGFHAFSMCDRPDNSRIRIRTTTGHQIIMDDTNERIYINTNEGENWIELDKNGNIDVFSSRRISFRSPEFNFTGKKYRVHVEEFDLYAKEEIRVHAGIHDEPKGKIHIKAGEFIKVFADGAGEDGKGEIHVRSTSDTLFYTEKTFHVKADEEIRLSAEEDINIGAAGNIIEEGAEIHMNGPSAAQADQAEENCEARWTNRVPDHEPWPRMMMEDTDNCEDNKHTPEFEEYFDEDIGRVELGKRIPRGIFWRR